MAYANGMRIFCLVGVIKIPDQLSVSGLLPNSNLYVLDVYRLFALTNPLRDLHQCVSCEELDVDLVSVVVCQVSPCLPYLVCPLWPSFSYFQICLNYLPLAIVCHALTFVCQSAPVFVISGEWRFKKDFGQTF